MTLESIINRQHRQENRGSLASLLLSAILFCLHKVALTGRVSPPVNPFDPPGWAITNNRINRPAYKQGLNKIDVNK